MSDFTQIPLPTVQNDFDFVWPNPSTGHNIGDAFDVNMGARYTGALSTLWTLNGGGTANMNLDPRGALCGQIASVPAGQVKNATGTGVQMRPPLLVGGVPTFEYSSWSRVWRWQFVFQLQLAVASSDGRSTFLGLIPNGGVGPDSAGASYFGIVLSTGGRWQYVSRAGGAGFGYSEVVDLFAAVTTPHMIDLEILSASGANNAVLRVFGDGNYASPLVVRNWGGGLLPSYTATVVNATAWQARVQANDAGQATVIQLLQSRLTAGQFTAQGQQLV